MNHYTTFSTTALGDISLHERPNLHQVVQFEFIGQKSTRCCSHSWVETEDIAKYRWFAYFYQSLKISSKQQQYQSNIAILFPFFLSSCCVHTRTSLSPVQNIELNLRWYISQQQGENLGIQTLLAKAPMSNYQDPSPP